VRAITADGGESPWSRGQSFKKLWAATTDLLAPTSGASVVYPTTPLELSWSPVPGARKYLVSIASDPALGSLVSGLSPSGGPAETTATTFTRTSALAPGTYYWGVTPVDAEGNRGVRSQVASFVWAWPSSTTPRVDDLDPATEVFDPQFSWNRVAGAARYEVEINSSSDFAPGSKVCCSGTTIATSLSPTGVLRDNTYYWRVRAVDVDGNAGVWNVGPSFTKAFDKVPPVAGTSIANVHLRDNATDDTVTADADHNLANGYQTTVPVVSWNPVPGASSYEVQVAPWSGSACNWAATPLYVKRTAVTAWTPLGFTTANPTLFTNVATDTIPQLTPGTYCFRVYARSDRAGTDEVLGDPTYVTNGNTDSAVPGGPAFTWTAYPSGGGAGCAEGGSVYPCAGDFLGPQSGVTTAATPLFTWQPIAGAASYFVVVAKDASFSTIVDEAFTRVPAYAPRNTSKPTTYSDETTSYYWAVLPSSTADGTAAVPLDPAFSSGNFQKQSVPPTLLAPATGSTLAGPVTFRWTPALGARRYELQVSQDPSFGTRIDDVFTDSTAYTSETTYPGDTLLYWRVRADDENLVGLAWSAYGTFQKTLPTPQLSPDNPAGGDFIPTWSWAPVPGAVAYDVSADLPDGTHRDLNGLRTAALTPVLMYGTGVFSWRVRAEFPKGAFGTTPGPYTATHTFVRTIGEPGGARADVAVDRVLLSWNAKPQVKGYQVQISARPSFIQPLETVTTDNTSYAPPLKWLALPGLDTGRLYWRVAAVDEGGNVGDYTPALAIVRMRRMVVAVSGSLHRRKRSPVTITVKNFESGIGVVGATVRISAPGMRARRLRTTVGGMARISLRPPRRGIVRLVVTAPGYVGARASTRVR
jgi:hypothetical protein